MRFGLDQRDLRAERRVDLRELAADRARAQHDQPPGQVRQASASALVHAGTSVSPSTGGATGSLPVHTTRSV